MAEHWEMCTLIIINTLPVKYKKTIYTSNGMQKSDGDRNSYEKDVCDLLAEGWEPFYGTDAYPSLIEHTFFFRRRIS